MDELSELEQRIKTKIAQTKDQMHKTQEAAESILGYFGFDRTVYGDRKWWYEIRQERRRDIETERNVYDG
jgi:hypothetical protein